MNPILLHQLAMTFLIGLFLCNSLMAATPADTYFSVAVSNNSHNHYGENLMFLDFQEQVIADEPHPRTVRALRVADGTVSLDGRLQEWKSDLFTRIEGRVMNNYPLSEHFDATPAPIEIAAAFDSEFIYFALRFEDANRDMSVNRNRWIYRDGAWQPMAYASPTAGSHAVKAVNRTDDLAGNEDEDQVFMMFPIVDLQGNFRDGSLGCGGYCHTNLALSADPTKAQIGDGVASMHTTHPDDLADLWHWTATRSRPANTLKDGYIDYGDQSYNGRKVDDGDAPFDNNAALNPYRPRYVSRSDYQKDRYSQLGFSTDELRKDDLLAITPGMQFAEGVSLPFYVNTPATGSRADVETAAAFDTESGSWLIEFRRRLVTGDPFDRQFEGGVDAVPPSAPLTKRGDPNRGEELYRERACAACHGDEGEGRFEEGRWIYPRNQRVSGPAIRRATALDRPERLQNLAHELKRYQEDPPEALMPFIRLTPQEAEDIAAWLQQRFTPRGQ